MYCYFASDPVVITVSWLIHHRTKTSTIKRRGIATRLHALDHKDVLLEYFFPLFGVHRTIIGVCCVRRVVKMDMLNGLVICSRFQHDCIGMVTLHTQQYIGIDGDIFSALIPLL